MKTLYLEGFSPGPGLPFPLLHGNKDIEVIHPRMPYYWIDILSNPYVWLSFGILSFLVWIIIPQLMNFQRHTLKAVTYYMIMFFVSLYFIYFFKTLAVRWTVDTCVKQMAKEINLHKPDVIIGYSWGGGIASFLIERKIWLGHTILIAPAGGLLAEKADLPLPSLQIYAQRQSKYLVIIQGTNDHVTPYSDNWQTYEDAVRDISLNPGTELMIQFLSAQGHDHALHGFVTRNLFMNLFQKMKDSDRSVSLGEWKGE
jgi:hypothetical protein